VLGAVLISLEGARRLSFDADVLSLLPRDSRVIQAFRTFLARFGSLDQLYVVFTAPEGHAISEYSDGIAAWTDRLRAAPEIARVDAGVVDRTRNFGWLADHQLLVLHDHLLDEALRRLSPDGMPAATTALIAFSHAGRPFQAGIVDGPRIGRFAEVVGRAVHGRAAVQETLERLPAEANGAGVWAGYVAAVAAGAAGLMSALRPVSGCVRRIGCDTGGTVLFCAGVSGSSP
jgi:hypothetical protein